MELFGIQSYPVRWQRLLWWFSLSHAMIALTWIGVLGSVMAEPSEVANRVFLSYSLERLVLISILITCVISNLTAIWVIKNRRRWVQTSLNFLDQTRPAKRIAALLTIVLCILGAVFAWWPGSVSLQAYFNKALPLLAWFVAVTMQSLVFLVYLKRKEILEFANRFTPADPGGHLHSNQSFDKTILAVLAGISLVYGFFQLMSYLDVRQAAMLGDSSSYLYGAGLSLNDPAFFSERRPWGILLIYKLLGGSQAAIEVFQLGLSTVVWLSLAWTFIRSLRQRWSGLIAYLTILGFSLTPAVQVWNHAVLSESLSISLLVLLLALLIGLFQQWRWKVLFMTCLVCGMWMSIHEANTYIGLLLAVGFLVFGIARPHMRAFWLLTFFVGVVFTINTQLSAAYGLPRWALPVAEVITKRILPNQAYLEFFSAHGMPVTPDLMAFSGRWANSDNYAIINSDPLKKFSFWLFRDGRSVYTQFLLSHPFYTLASPLKEIDLLLAGNYLNSFPIPGYSPALPGLINEFFYPESWFWLYLCIALALTGAHLFAQRKARNRVLWAVFLFFLLSVPNLYLAWHADALDVVRHAAIANVQYHLGLWLMLLFYLDLFTTNGRSKTASDLSAQTPPR